MKELLAMVKVFIVMFKRFIRLVIQEYHYQNEIARVCREQRKKEKK